MPQFPNGSELDNIIPRLKDEAALLPVLFATEMKSLPCDKLSKACTIPALRMCVLDRKRHDLVLLKGLLTSLPVMDMTKVLDILSEEPQRFLALWMIEGASSSKQPTSRLQRAPT